jgi:hypothetical protein
MGVGFDQQRYRRENWDWNDERRCVILRPCAPYAMARLLHVTFSGCRARVEILEDHFFGQMRAPFEKPLANRFDQG